MMLGKSMAYKEQKASDLHNATAVVRNGTGTCAAIGTNWAQDVLDAAAQKVEAVHAG
jgi:hypothetical protein